MSAPDITQPPNVQGQFFDGKSGAAQTVQVAIGVNGLTITTVQLSLDWPYRDIIQGSRSAKAIRLSNRRSEDAVLVLPSNAVGALHEAAPEIFSGARARQRMTALIVSLVAGAALITAGIFIGIPAASGPLAHATPTSLEKKIGENLSAQINTFLKPCGDDASLAALAPIIDELAANGEVGFPIRFQFVKTAMPNAFALPGGQIMATSGLLDAIGDDQEAFLAVIAHELGHVRNRDGMRAVYRNAGLGMALEIITGGSGVAQQAVLVSGQLSQLRYTRLQETAADDAAAEIMIAAHLDPAALGRAFTAITDHASLSGSLEDDGKDKKAKTKKRKDLPSWLRTHPDTQLRIKQARDRAHPGGAPPLSDPTWRQVVDTCNAPESAIGDDK